MDREDAAAGDGGGDPIRRFFFDRGTVESTPAELRRPVGCALAGRAGAEHFWEAALLGLLDDAPGAGAGGGGEGGGGLEVYLNTH